MTIKEKVEIYKVAKQGLDDKKGEKYISFDFRAPNKFNEFDQIPPGDNFGGSLVVAYEDYKQLPGWPDLEEVLFKECEVVIQTVPLSEFKQHDLTFPLVMTVFHPESPNSGGNENSAYFINFNQPIQATLKSGREYSIGVGGVLKNKELSAGLPQLSTEKFTITFAFN